MRPYTKEYLEEADDDSQIEFEIICTSDCENITKYSDFKCKRGDKFKTNEYEFNYGEGYLRLIVDGVVVGFFLNSNFDKLSDYRNKKIEEMLNETLKKNI